MSTEKLYLVEFSRSEGEPVRVLVPAESKGKAKAAALETHLSVREVGSVEAIGLSAAGVPILGRK